MPGTVVTSPKLDDTDLHGADETVAPPMAGAVGSGLSWLVFTTLLSKSLGLIQVVVVGYLLTEEDYGLYGMALGVYGFSQAFRDSGLRSLLIRNAKRFDELVGPCFWLGLSLNHIAIIVVLALGKALSIANDEPRLFPVVLVMAATLLVSPLDVVANGRLSIDLRFRALAGAALGSYFVRTGVVIAAAWAGLGALSFALAMFTAIAFRAVILARHAGLQPWRREASVRVWPGLLKEASWLMIGAAALALQRQGDFVAASFFMATSVLGLYVFAYQLIEQLDGIIATNVHSVLIPFLSMLAEEKHRLAAAYERAVTLLAFVTAPATLCLALVADSLVRLVWADRWVGAVPALQILCLFFFVKVLFSVPYSLLHGVGRFRMSAICTGIIGTAAVSAAALGAWAFGTAEAVAFAVGVALLCTGIIVLMVAHPDPRGRRLIIAARVLLPWMVSVVLAGLLFELDAVVAWPVSRLWLAIHAATLAASFFLAFTAASALVFRPQVAEFIRMSPAALRPTLERIAAPIGIEVRTGE